jgi:G:T-mismatch repair DNA endonuclease (very short patch repair protein)
MSIKITTEDFVLRARRTHGKFYDYSKVKYVNQAVKVCIVCPTHGKFEQLPMNHTGGSRCPSCAGLKPLTTEEFIKRSKNIHGSKYSYENCKYLNNNTKVKIRCKVHKSYFTQRPADHLLGAGCSLCAGVNTSTTSEFIKKARSIHGKLYSYSQVEYTNCKTKVCIECKHHGSFWQIPSSHLRGRGCPECVTRNYSKLAIKWIEEYTYSHRLKNVQHAANGGEFKIPGTNFRVDGYHKASNTVFEFYGDYWHGGTRSKKSQSKVHPHSTVITIKQLRQKTRNRERKIKSLGYNLIVVWESDYLRTQGSKI